jgi:hypothetical protein
MGTASRGHCAVKPATSVCQQARARVASRPLPQGVLRGYSRGGNSRRNSQGTYHFMRLSDTQGTQRWPWCSAGAEVGWARPSRALLSRRAAQGVLKGSSRGPQGVLKGWGPTESSASISARSIAGMSTLPLGATNSRNEQPAPHHRQRASSSLRRTACSVQRQGKRSGLRAAAVQRVPRGPVRGRYGGRA